MQLPSLVTSVPDLHTARILAAAGVPYLVFRQDTENLPDLIQWLEGPQVGLEILEAESRISAVDFLMTFLMNCMINMPFQIKGYSGKRTSRQYTRKTGW